MLGTKTAFVLKTQTAKFGLIAVLMFSWLSLAGCGGGGGSSNQGGGGGTQTQTPAVTSVSPSPVPALNGTQSLTINGNTFQSGATVTYHDPKGNTTTGHATTFTSSSQLVDAAFNNANEAGTWTVTVVNPGSVSSNAFSFTVSSATPVVTGVSPSPVPALNAAQTLTINGNTFQSGATLTYVDPNGNTTTGHATTFTSSSQLVDAAFNDANEAGTWTVTVVNPGSISSTAFSFTVGSATPVVTGVSPSPVPGLKGAQTLTINGNTFQSGATLTYVDPNGNATTGHAATVSSSSQIVDSAFNNGDVAGTWTVTVVNPANISSNAFTFTVTPTPIVTGVSPSPVPALYGTQSLTINGSTFLTGATLTYLDPKGNTTTGHPTFVNSGQLVDGAFNNLNEGGTWTVTVVNPGSFSSSAFSFTVTSATPVITGISPDPVPGMSGAQSLTINGNTFQSGATVTLRDPSGNTTTGQATTFNSTTQIVDSSFNNADTAGTWTVTVVNPGDITSNSYSFSVKPSTPSTLFSMVQHTSSTCTTSTCADTITATAAGDLLVLWSAATYSGTDPGTPGNAHNADFTAASGDSTWTHCPNQIVNYVDNVSTAHALDCWYILSAKGGAASVSATWTFTGLTSPTYAVADELVELKPSSTPIYYDTGNATDNFTNCSTSCTGPAGLLSGTDAVLQATILSSLPTGIGAPYGTPDIVSNVNAGFSVALNQATYTAPVWQGTTSGNPNFYSTIAFGNNPNPIPTFDFLMDFNKCTVGSAPTAACLTNSAVTGEFQTTPYLSNMGPNLLVTNTGPSSLLPLTPTIVNGTPTTAENPLNLGCTTAVGNGTTPNCGSVTVGVDMVPTSISIGYTIESSCPATGVDCGATGGIFSRDGVLDFDVLHLSPLGNGKICFETKNGSGCTGQTQLDYAPNTAYRVNMQINNYPATTNYITVCEDGPGGAVLGSWTNGATSGNAVENTMVLGFSGEEPMVAGYTYSWRNVVVSLTGRISSTSCF